jgi:hypothetical protein
MSFKSKVLAAAAALTMVGGAGAMGAFATATAANAATPSCGNSCINIFSREFGTHANPAFVVDVLRQGEKVGQPIILFRTSNADPAEDFTISFQGLVSDFFAAGLVSSAVALHYGGGVGCNPATPATAAATCDGFADDPAFEIEYAPFGVDSGLCMGLASAPFFEEKVTLQPCGVTAKTVWIADAGLNPKTASFNPVLADDPIALFHHYAPAINGADTNFSHPFVLTYPQSGYPTNMPRPGLEVTNLTGFSNGLGPIVGSVPDYQLWGADFGVLK